MSVACPNFGPEYFMQVLDDEDNVIATRKERSFMIQRCIDRFGIDHVRLMCCGGSGGFFPPQHFGFHQSRVTMNSALAEARHRLSQRPFGLGF